VVRQLQLPANAEEAAMKTRSPQAGHIGIAITGLILVLGFFLPWVKACGADFTGLDIATNKYGNVEGAQLYWLVLIAALIAVGVVGFELLLRRVSIMSLAVGLASSVISGIPLLGIWANVAERKGAMEPRAGLYLSSLGALGMGISALVGFLLRQPQQAHLQPWVSTGSVACPHCNSLNPPGNEVCTNCGHRLIPTESG
jgi:hypothetical protein